MSLFLGNLSATIQREDIEREFGRFGMCYINMKNGYGFAVYEVYEDAERALRTLCGKNICGQQISLSWSNRQPKYFRQFSRDNKYDEHYPGRNNRGGFVNARYRNTYNQKHFVRQSVNNRVQNRKVNHSAENLEHPREESKQSVTEAVPNAIFSHESPDRWDGAVVTDTLGETGVKNDATFERYKPQNDFENENILKNLRDSDSNGSPMQVSLLDKRVREQSNDAHVSQIETTERTLLCSNCGPFGHMMDKCPREATRLERFGRLGDNRNVDHAGGSRVSESENVKKHDKRDGKGNHKSKDRLEHQRRKRRKHGDGSLNKRDRKRRRRSCPSSSNECSPRSQSRASKSSSNISSHPSSKPFHSHSNSTMSRSASVQSNPKSKISCLKSITSVDDSQSISSDVKLSPKKNRDVSPTVCIFPHDHEFNVAKPNTGKNRSADFEVTETNRALEVEITDTSFNTGHITHKDQGDDEHMKCFSSKNMGVEEEDIVFATLNQIPLTSTKLPENIKKKYEHRESSLSNSRRHHGDGNENYMDEAAKKSQQEMHMGLKHYGLTLPGGHEQDISAGTFFGASRLWPWEIIYYRRLKKGPISTENYARRVTQNKEFGIVDKYIRSSTGWGERYGSSS